MPLAKQNRAPRLMKQTTFNYTTNMQTVPNTLTIADISANKEAVHSAIVTKHLTESNHTKILQALPPNICSSEETLPRHTRRTQAQLRTNKSPFVKSYLHKMEAHKHPSPLCPLCKTGIHTTQHPFNCKHIQPVLTPWDLWTNKIKNLIFEEEIFFFVL